MYTNVLKHKQVTTFKCRYSPTNPDAALANTDSHNKT